MTVPTLLLPAATDAVDPVAGDGQLITAALVGIAVLVLLITVVKLHPFLSLTIGSLVVGLVATMPMVDTVAAFTKGFGETSANVGILVALGAMFGKLLADSGGADAVVDAIVGRSSPRVLPWAMAGIGALIGLPMFFEIGLVLLLPIVFLVAKRSEQNVVALGIPALAGLSAMHAFVPPHPGPLIAIDAVGADLGTTLGLGILVALPTIVVAGPLFGMLAARWVRIPAPTTFERTNVPEHGARPSFGATVATILLPIVLMMAKAVVDVLEVDNWVGTALDFLGTPIIALLISVLVAMVVFGRGARMSRDEVMKIVEGSLPGVAGIILIVGAGGGFKETLIETGIAQVVADWVSESGFSVLVVAWLVAVGIRLATGSATVATVTAAGIMAPIAEGLGSVETSLLVLAIGAGSVFFSHVNDAGFWLVKEYFRMDVPQTIKTWSLMETVLSVTGLGVVLLADLLVGLL